MLPREINACRGAAVLLATPTLLVAAVWIASGLAPYTQFGWPAPGITRWRIVRNYVQVERTSAAVPVASLPAGAVPASWSGPPYNGAAFGSSYVGGGGGYFFGWVETSGGHYFLGTQAIPSRIVKVSLVIPLILTLPLAWLAARLWMRPTTVQRRRFAGLCAACGYDLRASPGRCPECGVETPAAGSHPPPRPRTT